MMMNARRPFVISTIVSMFVLVTIATSMMVAGDNVLRRLRRHHYQQQAVAAVGESLEEAVYDQYLDLAKLVTDEHTLQLVEEREKTFGERKMIAVDDFEVMDHVRLYELFGMSVSSEVPLLLLALNHPRP
jgi:hypothetical protein